MCMCVTLQGPCSDDIDSLYRVEETAFKSDAFLHFTSIYDMTHDSMKLRWQPDMNRGDDLVFEGHLQTAAGADLNATVRALYGDRSSIHVIPSMWELVIRSVKREVKCKF
jgi:hypothetical protein